MGKSDEGADGKLPFKAKPDVGHDGDNRNQHGDRARAAQFARDRRADDFDTALLEGVAENALHLLQCVLLRGIATRLLLDADQDIFGRTEGLNLHVAQIELTDFRAQRRQIGGSDLDFTSIMAPPLKSTP